LEIARVTARVHFQTAKGNLEFIFFDGEEAIESYNETDGLYGSRYYVEMLRSKNAVSKVKAFILMDMIGDRDLSIQIPQSDPDLTQRVFGASQELGYREYFRYSEGGIIDDHSPFVQAGIPAIDIIDFSFGPNNSWWHTSQDTIDKLSSDSLKIVGQTVLKLLEKF
jgi:glutaminyl-peptide cyclotransferase